MSEVPTAQSLLDGFDEAKKSEAAYVNEAYRMDDGRIAGVNSFGEDARKQLEDQAAYESYMNKFANRTDAEVELSRESARDNILRGIDDNIDMNNHIDDVEAGNRLDYIERSIMNHQDKEVRLKLKFMRNLALEVAKLKKTEVTEDRADRDSQLLIDREDALAERLADFESSYVIDAELEDILSRIIELTDGEFGSAATTTTHAKPATEPTKEKAKRTGEWEPTSAEEIELLEAYRAFSDDELDELYKASGAKGMFGGLEKSDLKGLSNFQALAVITEALKDPDYKVPKNSENLEKTDEPEQKTAEPKGNDLLNEIKESYSEGDTVKFYNKMTSELEDWIIDAFDETNDRIILKVKNAGKTGEVIREAVDYKQFIMDQDWNGNNLQTGRFRLSDEAVAAKAQAAGEVPARSSHEDDDSGEQGPKKIVEVMNRSAEEQQRMLDHINTTTREELRNILIKALGRRKGKQQDLDIVMAQGADYKVKLLHEAIQKDYYVEGIDKVKKGLVGESNIEHPGTRSLPPSFGEKATQVIDSTELNNSTDDEKRFKRLRKGLEKVRNMSGPRKALGLGMVAMAVAAGVVVVRNGGDPTVVKETAKAVKDGFGIKLGTPGAEAANRAAELKQALESMPVADGSGGYDLIDTLGTKLGMQIPHELWDQHQDEIRQILGENGMSGPNGELWLRDTSPNSSVSSYNLSAAKDAIQALIAR